MQAVQNHSKIKCLNLSYAVLKENVMSKPFLKYDHTTDNIKINIKIPRNILILRNVSSNLQEDSLRQYLQQKLGNLYNNLKSLKSELNDNWLASFTEEAHAMEAFTLLQDQTLDQ